jgi:glycosyltransferase involved in cell wall biosynthesis
MCPSSGSLRRCGPKRTTCCFSAPPNSFRALPDARFLIVGDGPQREQIEVAARGAGMSEQVLLLGSRQDIPDLLAALDLFVLTSRTEANPVSILEAMATGLPVVATRVGSVPETVLDGQTGYLVESGDAEAMARRCLELMTQPAAARQCGARARAVVEQRWSLQQMVRGYEQLIESVYRQKCGSGGAAQQEHPARDDREAVVRERGLEPVG